MTLLFFCPMDLLAGEIPPSTGKRAPVT